MVNCTCQSVGRPGVGAGLGMGVALAGGTCAHCLHCWCGVSCCPSPAVPPDTCQGRTRLFHVSPGCLGVYLCSSSGMNPTQLFPGAGWECHPLPIVRCFKFGKKIFFLGRTFLLNEAYLYLPLRGSLWLNVKVHDRWLSF